MRIISSIDEMIETARGWLTGGTVGFIPTMGLLHRGHLSLIQAARNECEISVVSIFVNPLQFSSEEEFKKYPRNITQDLMFLRQVNVDVVFLPRAEDLCPPATSTYITLIGALADRWGGKHNPHYIRGIATIMTKLFHLVRPDIVYFGQKDAQQIAVAYQVVRDLNIDIQLRILPIVRESDGLAMSSRNSLLSPLERQAALMLYQALLKGKALIERGERDSQLIEQAMIQHVQSNPLVVLDYAVVCDPESFEKLPAVKSGTLLIIAAQIGAVRLIDNIVWQSDGQWLM